MISRHTTSPATRTPPKRGTITFPIALAASAYSPVVLCLREFRQEICDRDVILHMGSCGRTADLTRRVPTATVDYCVKSLVNESEASFHIPLCCTYTSITMKGLVTSLPPTTASRRILFNRMAVVPMNRTDDSKISACL